MRALGFIGSSSEGVAWSVVRTCASSQSTSEEADATSNDCSLKLPHQTPMTPCRAVEPDPCANDHDQQKDQASLGEVLYSFPHFSSAAFKAVSPSSNCE